MFETQSRSTNSATATTNRKTKIPFTTSFMEVKKCNIDVGYWNSLAETVNRHFASFGVSLEQGKLEDVGLCFYVVGLSPELVQSDERFRNRLLQLHLYCKTLGFSRVEGKDHFFKKPGDSSCDYHPIYYVLVTEDDEQTRLNPLNVERRQMMNDLFLFIFFVSVVAFSFYYLFYHQLKSEAEPWKKLALICWQVWQTINPANAIKKS
jgi:hypothetical protein